jgi:hypothetical protein
VIVFTICARNFLAHALVLHDSLVRHHPDAMLHVVLCDSSEGIETEAFPFEILPLGDLDVPRLPDMLERYNITELNTSLKPFVFAFLFDRFPGRPVLYLDPDILVVSRMAELEQALDEGADCVLTPHLCEPAEFAEMHDGRMLQYGIYNLGFCALRDTPETRRVVAWWGRRLEQLCIIDLPNGLFVDQKWADLLPAFLERTRILHHRGYNVAYWNLSQRTVRNTESGWEVNRVPLRFVHFSGCGITKPEVFSRHSLQFTLARIGDLATLFGEYAEAMRGRGHSWYARFPYAFRWDGQSGPNLHAPAALSRNIVPARQSASWLAGEALPHLPVARVGRPEDLANVALRLGAVAHSRRLVEQVLMSDPEPEAECVICGGPRWMRPASRQPQRRLLISTSALAQKTNAAVVDDDEQTGVVAPNWLERLVCAGCGLGSGARAAFHLLAQELRPAASARILVSGGAPPSLGPFISRFGLESFQSKWNLRRTPPTASPSRGEGEAHASYFSPCGRGQARGGTTRPHVLPDNAGMPNATGARDEGRWDVIVDLTQPQAEYERERALPDLRAQLRPGGALVLAPLDGEGLTGLRNKLMQLRAVGFNEIEALIHWSRRHAYFGPMRAVTIARR